MRMDEYELEDFDDYTASAHRAIAEFISLEIQKMEYQIDELKKLQAELLARAAGLDEFANEGNDEDVPNSK